MAIRLVAIAVTTAAVLAGCGSSTQDRALSGAGIGAGVGAVGGLLVGHLVRRSEQEETAGGILIPNTAKENPMGGEVVAVGSGVCGEDGKLHPLDVKPGDRVLFGKWSGTEVRVDDEELVIIKESDLMGIIEGA